MYRLVLPRASEEAPRPKVGIGRSWLARWGRRRRRPRRLGRRGVRATPRVASASSSRARVSSSHLSIVSRVDLALPVSAGSSENVSPPSFPATNRLWLSFRVRAFTRALAPRARARRRGDPAMMSARDQPPLGGWDVDFVARNARDAPTRPAVCEVGVDLQWARDRPSRGSSWTPRWRRARGRFARARLPARASRASPEMASRRSSRCTRVTARVARSWRWTTRRGPRGG